MSLGQQILELRGPVNPEFKCHREELEHRVAKKFGKHAPWPKAAYQDRYSKWEWRNHIVNTLERDLAEDEQRMGPSAIRRAKQTIESAKRKRDRLKLPEGYLSWAHVAAFSREVDEVLKENATKRLLSQPLPVT